MHDVSNMDVPMEENGKEQRWRLGVFSHVTFNQTLKESRGGGGGGGESPN